MVCASDRPDRGYTAGSLLCPWVSPSRQQVFIAEEGSFPERFTALGRSLIVKVRRHRFQGVSL